MRTESRWLLISIYNVIFVGLSVLLLAAKDSGMTDDSLLLYAEIMIAVITTNMVSAVVVPMFFARLWTKIQSILSTMQVTELDLANTSSFQMQTSTEKVAASPVPSNNNQDFTPFPTSSTAPAFVPARQTMPPTEIKHSFSAVGSKSEIVQRKPY